MSNVETKRIRHTNFAQFLLEVQELIQNGWSVVVVGSTATAGIQFTANFQRSVKQSDVKSEVVKEVVKEEVGDTQKPEATQQPVKAAVKTQTAKTTTKK